MLYNQIDLLLLIENGNYDRELVSALWSIFRGSIRDRHLKPLYRRPYAISEADMIARNDNFDKRKYQPAPGYMNKA